MATGATDATGQFHLPRLPAEERWLVLGATTPGFLQRTWRVSTSESRPLELTLAAASVLAGQVLAAEGDAVAKAHIRWLAQEPTPDPAPTTETDANGFFEFAVAAGKGTLEVSSPPFQSALIRDLAAKAGVRRDDLQVRRYAFVFPPARFPGRLRSHSGL